MRKTMVSYGAETHLVDTIEREGKVWLVGAWLPEGPDGSRAPLRLIPLARLHHQTLTQVTTADFLVTAPLPEELFATGELPASLARRYGVVERPDLRGDAN